MKLGELKKALGRFPPDMDDMELIVQYVNENGSEDIDLLVYVAYAQYKSDVHAICVGTWKMADKLREKRFNDPRLFPKGYVPHPSTKLPNKGSRDK